MESDLVAVYPIKLMAEAGSDWTKLLYQTAEREWRVEIYQGASYDSEASLITSFYDAAIICYNGYHGS